MSCLFCRIAGGEVPSNKVYEDDRVYAFHDIDPQAPVHVLIIPKTHIAGTDELCADNVDVVAHIYALVPQIAKQLGLQKGYRVVTNCGEDGNQTVPHLHFHLLGGRALSWPPG